MSIPVSQQIPLWDCRLTDWFNRRPIDWQRTIAITIFRWLHWIGERLAGHEVVQTFKADCHRCWITGHPYNSCPDNRGTRQFGWHSKKVENAATAALGRTISFDGHLYCEVSFRWTVELDGLRLSNPPDWDLDDFDNASWLRARIRMLPPFRLSQRPKGSRLWLIF